MKKIGIILKTKGFDGTTIVEFDFPLIREDIKALFITKGAMKQPLLIERIEQNGPHTFYIKWKNYDTKEQAQALHNKELFLDEMLFEQWFEEMEMEDFMGYKVFNRDEEIGKVVGLYETTQQETIEVELKTNKKLLIPLNDHYILTIDDTQQIIYCDLTAEYVELFSS